MTFETSHEIRADVSILTASDISFSPPLSIFMSPSCGIDQDGELAHLATVESIFLRVVSNPAGLTPVFL